jgi:hypothetical protein
MAKQATTQLKPVAADDRNAASETLMQIVELVLPFRHEGVPTVDLIARLAAQSSRLLRLEQDEATAAQNAATLGLMRKHQLIAE